MYEEQKLENSYKRSRFIGICKRLDKINGVIERLDKIDEKMNEIVKSKRKSLESKLPAAKRIRNVKKEPSC